MRCTWREGSLINVTGDGVNGSALAFFAREF